MHSKFCEILSKISVANNVWTSDFYSNWIRILIKIPPSLENSQILTRDNSCLNKPNHGYNRMQMWPRQYESNPWEYEIITKDTMLKNLSPKFIKYVQKGISKVLFHKHYSVTVP